MYGNTLHCAKLVNADIPLFDGILRDLFPNTPAFSPTEAALEAQIIRECERLKLQSSQYMLDKIRQVNFSRTIFRSISVLEI